MIHGAQSEELGEDIVKLLLEHPKCDANAKETSWYHWAKNTRRAVTFLEKSEVADVE